MDDKATNSKKTWAYKQNDLQLEYKHLLLNRQSRDLSPDEEKRLKELPKEYFELCKDEAKEDMEAKDYLHLLTHVYVEVSGTVEARVIQRNLQENLIHAMRRATTLNARLGYDTAGTTKWIMILTWVIAGSALVTLFFAFIQAIPVVKSLFCK